MLFGHTDYLIVLCQQFFIESLIAVFLESRLTRTNISNIASTLLQIIDVIHVFLMVDVLLKHSHCC